MGYKKGKPSGPLEAVGKSEKTGTFVRFYPDRDVFNGVSFNYSIIFNRLLELSFLNPGINIFLYDEKNTKKNLFFSRGGITSFVKHLNKEKELIHNDIFFFEKERDNMKLSLSMQWNTSYIDKIFCYTNNIRQKDGGTHLSSYKTALTR